MTKGTRYFLTGIILSFFVLVLILSWNLYPLFRVPMTSKDTPSPIVRIDRSVTASKFVHLLEEKKLIQSPRIFLMLIRIEGVANKIRAGTYQIKQGETATQLLSRVVAGDVLTQKFTIIAGTTQHKVANDLMHAEHLTYRPDDWAYVRGNHPHAEGLLLADTYQYSSGSNTDTILKQAHNSLMSYLNKAWLDRAPNLPYKTPYELLIAASIIEKESAQSQERKIIGGVLVNRLNKGMPLQMDPTVIYGLSTDYKGKLYRKDLLVITPYNTYRYKGLPPTPIAMVGKEVIDAAAHPQLSNYLYYVSKGDGTHQFSESYEQQRHAIRQYQRKDI